MTPAGNATAQYPGMYQSNQYDARAMMGGGQGGQPGPHQPMFEQQFNGFMPWQQYGPTMYSSPMGMQTPVNQYPPMRRGPPSPRRQSEPPHPEMVFNRAVSSAPFRGHQGGTHATPTQARDSLGGMDMPGSRLSVRTSSPQSSTHDGLFLPHDDDNSEPEDGVLGMLRKFSPSLPPLDQAVTDILERMQGDNTAPFLTSPAEIAEVLHATRANIETGFHDVAHAMEGMLKTIIKNKDNNDALRELCHRLISKVDALTSEVSKLPLGKSATKRAGSNSHPKIKVSRIHLATQTESLPETCRQRLRI